ncbi:MAG: hypothetical protein KME21_22785 [Desmonostoc vinosum HA7617-LM4]|nr:hypothetical protein [Desmonostoc vinosum HA7617-LM4]
MERCLRQAIAFRTHRTSKLRLASITEEGRIEFPKSLANKRELLCKTVQEHYATFWECVWRSRYVG